MFLSLNVLVFFGVEVSYATAAQGTTQAQQNSARYFPTQIKCYQEIHKTTKKPGTWESQKTGIIFTFTDAQPTDPGTTIDLSAITKQQLQQRVFNYNWDDDDVTFLHSLAGAGAKKAIFEGLIDANSTLGPAESAAAALDSISYNNTRTFGERINNQQAIDALGTKIGQGFVVID